MKHFNPDLPQKAIHNVTIKGNKITLSGSSGTANITINGVVNTTIATFADSLTATAAAWVAANFDYYFALGFVVTASSGVITILPRYGWETVNRIDASIANATTDLTGAVTGTCEVDPTKAKVWRITLANSITMTRPRETYDGDKIRLEFINPSTYTVTWTAGTFFFPGGTEPTVTVNSKDVFEAIFQATNTTRVHTITLSGNSGTASVSMGGVTKTATYSSSLNTTASNFVSANAAAYLAVGITLTAGSGTLIFTTNATTRFMAPPTIYNATLTLAGTVTTAMEGRWLVIDTAQNVIQ